MLPTLFLAYLGTSLGLFITNNIHIHKHIHKQDLLISSRRAITYINNQYLSSLLTHSLQQQLRELQNLGHYLIFLCIIVISIQRYNPESGALES